MASTQVVYGRIQALVLFTLCAQSMSLQCYHCTQKKQPNCFESQEFANPQVPVVSCGPPGLSPDWACVTSVRDGFINKRFCMRTDEIHCVDIPPSRIEKAERHCFCRTEICNHGTVIPGEDDTTIRSYGAHSSSRIPQAKITFTWSLFLICRVIPTLYLLKCC
ncbi:unnamed protein product [Allacma fusca]|uniref:Protein quiver n=1 Tax=Allacma fusca TaxID=39272 RepID=A0A8J2PGS4_9HEXA|nr:unnamed protein product [Allacma fusca]